MKEFLPRLDLKLDIHTVNDAQAQPHHPQAGGHEGPEKDLVWSDHIKNSRDPFIAVHEGHESAENDAPTILAIWEIKATLNRPRIRFPRPAVTFTASASLTPAGRADESKTENEYLPSLLSAPINIFERLATIPALRDQAPYLPASRIESVLPGPQLDSDTLHIRHQPMKRFPVSPAVSARIRCSRMNTGSPRPPMIASLDFEVTPFATFDVLLNQANISLASDGQIELLGPLEMPVICRPRDTVTFLYRIQPPSNATESPLPISSTSPNAVGLLDIVLESALQISSTCKPVITMRWRSNQDFSTPIDPRFGPSSQNLQRPNRPNSLPFSTSNTAITSSFRPSTPHKDNRPTSLTATTTKSSFRSGLTISFTAPITIPLGRIFPLTILLTNHSPRPLRLAIIPIPRRAPGSNLSSRKHAPKPSASSSLDRRHLPHPNAGQVVDIAPAVMDENIIYALQKAGINANTDTELVPISTDVRVGPLGVGSCHELQIKLLGLRVGVVRLEAVRVVDLGREADGKEAVAVAGSQLGVSSGVVDVRGEYLPEIVVVEGEGGYVRQGGEGE